MPGRTGSSSWKPSTTRATGWLLSCISAPQVFTLRDGKQAGMEMYSNRDEALEAVEAAGVAVAT